ncbi:MAG: methionine--tRNA ligase [Xanthomonadales bacterium]|nr:methionine--tRNA ligase [Xanthomonadales bacterium]
MPAPAPLFVTCALPYANGPLHLGHLVGYVQADVWVRALRMLGREIRFVCADDAHGTPIMLAAEQSGEDPERFIARIRESHERDFADFLVAFDHYHSTHSEENRELSAWIYARLAAAGLIRRERVRRLYDPLRGMFLPDRYVRGTCPRCGAPDQYGDNCEACGASYDPTELIAPRSALSGAEPELRESEHLFFRLSACAGFLREWLAGEVAHPAVRAKLGEWLAQGLKDWDISRDAPYFGFEIPGERDKFFYVWLDAPIGYLASLKALCARRGEDFAPWIDPSSPAEMHHFLGKDIVTFHGLFWPALLHGAGLKTPRRLHVNGYLTVNGAKMSKSRGTFLLARSFLDAGLPAEALRYYYASRLGPGVEDLDLDLADFVSRVNAELVGKLVNIAARAAALLERAGLALAPEPPAGAAPAAEREAAARLWEQARRELAETFADYEAGEYARALRRVMAVADRTNEHFTAAAPWRLAQDPEARESLALVLSLALNLFRAKLVALAPVLPATAEAVRAWFGEPEPWTAAALGRWVGGRRLPPYRAFWNRIEPKAVAGLVERSRELPEAAPAPAARAEPATIALEDFERLDLRVARIAAAESVPGADRLLRLELDLGPLGRRTVFAGIRAAYPDPAALVGRLVVAVANLAPRRMRFGVSEGMVLAAGADGGLPRLLAVDPGAEPGMRVR